MLTQRHLTIIRAALQFFSEELGPHGPEAFEDYLPDESIESMEVHQLCDRIDRCEIVYARVEPGKVAFIDPDMSELSDANVAGLATVLFLPPNE